MYFLSGRPRPMWLTLVVLPRLAIVSLGMAAAVYLFNLPFIILALRCPLYRYRSTSCFVCRNTCPRQQRRPILAARASANCCDR